jgi:hypothetical protein
MKKVKTMMLALGLGLGLSGMMSGYAISAPNSAQCKEAKERCQQTGDVGYCSFYEQQCKLCELNPLWCDAIPRPKP